MNISYAIRSFNITTKTNGRVINPFYHHGTEQLQSNVMIVQNTQHKLKKKHQNSNRRYTGIFIHSLYARIYMHVYIHKYTVNISTLYTIRVYNKNMRPASTLSSELPLYFTAYTLKVKVTSTVSRITCNTF